MKTVSQLLQGKGGSVWSVAPDSSVFDALKMMAEKNCSALLVMSDDKLRGILSERDYARKVILLGKSSHELAVREIMSDKVLCVGPAQTVDGIIRRNRNRFRSFYTRYVESNWQVCFKSRYQGQRNASDRSRYVQRSEKRICL